MKPLAIKKISVRNMRSYKGTGNEVPNQIIITAETKNGCVRVFQSYDTIIAIKDENGKVTLDKNNWNYSQATSNYRNQFLRENTADTRRKIQQGIYKLADLN